MEGVTFFRPPADHAVASVLGAVGDLDAAREIETDALLGFQGSPVDGGLRDPRLFATGGGERPARLTVYGGVLHPALAPAAADLLGVSADEALAAARCEGYLLNGEFRHDVPGEPRPVQLGAARLRELLAAPDGKAAGAARRKRLAELAAIGCQPADLILRRVPVLPPSARPVERRAGGRLAPGAVDEAYARLARASRTLRQFDAESRPRPVIEAGQRECQIAFEELDRAVRAAFPETPASGAATRAGAAPRQRTSAGASTNERPPTRDERARADVMRPRGAPPEDPRSFLEVPPPDQPIACAFAGDDRLVVQFPTSLSHLSRRGGRRLERYAIPLGARLLAVDLRGRRALFFGGGRFGVLDLERTRWADGYVPGLPYAVVRASERNPEAAELVVGREGRAFELRELRDYPVVDVLDAGMRYAWVTDKEGIGGVYRLRDGRFEGDARALDPDETTPALSWTAPRERKTRGSARRTAGDEGGAELRLEADLPGSPWCAFTRARDGSWWRLDTDGVISKDGVPYARLRMRVAAAAFSRGGESLLLVRRGGALLVALGARRPRIRARYEFANSTG